MRSVNPKIMLVMKSIETFLFLISQNINQRTIFRL